MNAQHRSRKSILVFDFWFLFLFLNLQAGVKVKDFYFYLSLKSKTFSLINAGPGLHKYQRQLLLSFDIHLNFKLLIVSELF